MPEHKTRRYFGYMVFVRAALPRGSLPRSGKSRHVRAELQTAIYKHLLKIVFKLQKIFTDENK